MKKLFAFLFAGLFMFGAEANAAVNAAKAEQFIKDVTKQGIEELVNSDISESEKRARFTKLFNQDLDLDFIGKFVLGRYWRTATQKQRDEFIDVYRKLNVQTWSERFNDFKGKHFEFLGTENSKSVPGGMVFNISPKLDCIQISVAFSVAARVLSIRIDRLPENTSFSSNK